MRKLLVLAFACLSCGTDESGRGWDGEERDSAGLRIVENGARGVWTEGNGWSVRPSLSIGGGPGEDDDLVAVAGLATDSRGRVLVLDVVARQVRVFDSSGALTATIGRSGEGPGEFSRFLTGLVVGPGDSVIVPDWGHARVSVFAPEGTFARQMLALARIETQGWQRLDDGGYLLRGVTIGRDENNRYTTHDALYRTNAGITVVDTLIEFDYPRSDLGGPGLLRAPLIVNAAFWTRLEDGRIAWSTLDRAEVYVHDAEGMRRSILRQAAWVREPLTEDHRNTMKQRFRDKFRLLGANPEVIDNLDLLYEETLPALTAVQAGPANTLWVQRMGGVEAIDPLVINTNDRTDGLGGDAWDVFDAELRFLGTVRLPPRFRIFHITADAVWGVRKDADDVELVERLDLDRPD